MQHQNIPHAVSKVEGNWHKKVIADFSGLSEGIVQIGPEKWVMPAKFEKFADEIYNFQARPDDVWICTLPRSGTTWTQEMIWLICNDLDYELAKNKTLEARFPFLENNVWMSDDVLAGLQPYINESYYEEYKTIFEPLFSEISSMTSRRFIKTHLPMKIMPPSVHEVGAKIVYVARNPKDVCVSYFHFSKSYPGIGFNGDFKSFSDFFMKGLTVNTPYWKHVLDGWQNRHRDNVHFMFYEDCKADLASSLKKLAEFLGHPLQDKDLPKLMEHLSFLNVRDNSAINYSLDPTVDTPNLIRRGLVGGNPEITQEISEKIDEWARANLAGTNLRFPIDV